MDFTTLSTQRYSVRKFQDTPVKKEDLDIILNAARSAPTAGNRQPQRILVLTKAGDLEKIDACTKCRFGAPVVLVICADTSVCWVRPFDGAKSDQVDASIVTTQMMLQAADIGLGTTWVMYFDPAKLIAEFKLPEKLLPVAVLILGYPASDAQPAERHAQRNPLESIAFYNRFPDQV
ncbi:MAG: nitroreductase family protein [Spirochaetales bacterium]|jgi:nitroreductase|nr:nitroreductase family protein [Spirochaetales bacterium]